MPRSNLRGRRERCDAVAGAAYRALSRRVGGGRAALFRGALGSRASGSDRPRGGDAAHLEHLTRGTAPMELTPREKDKLLLFTAGLVAERRLARGLKLNYPEAVAYVSAASMEGARDGRTVAELMSHGTTLMTRGPEQDGGPDMIPDVQL